MKTITVRREDESPVCVAEVADNWWTRLRGLLGRRRLADGRGLLIVPCVSVHTAFMLFTIDVVYLSAENRIVKCTRMRPFRFSIGGKGAAKVLELPPGTIGHLDLRPGETLQLTDSAP